MSWMEWYSALIKPSWTPSPLTISAIWAVLYPFIAASFGFVFVQAAKRRVNLLVALPFAINLVANLSFMPLFSGLRSVPLSTADIVIVWVTLVWSAVAIWPSYKWIAAMQLPYFVWVSIATTIQLSIAWENWPHAVA